MYINLDELIRCLHKTTVHISQTSPAPYSCTFNPPPPNVPQTHLIKPL